MQPGREMDRERGPRGGRRHPGDRSGSTRAAFEAGSREPVPSMTRRAVTVLLAVGFVACAALAWALLRSDTLLAETPAQLGRWAADVGPELEPGFTTQTREILALRRVGAGVAGLVSVLGLLALGALLRQRSRLRRPIDRVHWAVGATRTHFAARALGETWRPVVVTGVLALAVGVSIGPVVEGTFPDVARVPETGFLAGALLVALGTVLLHRGSRAGDRARRPQSWVSRILSAPAAVGAVGFAALVTVALTREAEGLRAAESNLDGAWVARLDLGTDDPDTRGARTAAWIQAGAGEVGIASTGTVRGAGSRIRIQVDCGRCSLGGLPLPVRSVSTEVHAVAPDTFAAMGLELLQGRDFSPEDRGDEVGAAIVSRSMAVLHFQDGRAVGRRIRFPDSGWIEVVGVVEDRPDVREADEFALYLPILQARPEVVEVFGDDPGGVVAAAASERSGGGRFLDIRPAVEVFAAHRWFRALLSLLGGIALVLAGAGVWAGARAEVAAEAPETALRRALGAGPRRLWRHFGRFALRQCGGALLVGGWLAVALAIELERSYGRLPLLDWRIWAGAAAPVVVLFLLGAVPPFRAALRGAPAAALGELRP